MSVPHASPAAVEDPEPQEPRTYAITGGRTTARYTLRPETLLASGDADADRDQYSAEHGQILAECGRHAIASVAEIAHAIGLPLFATKILIADLLDTGALCFPRSASAEPGTDIEILRRVRDGLRLLV